MVGTHCTRDVVIGQRHQPLAEAAQRMRDRHVGDLVIVDNLENRNPVGMLTDRDIVVGPVAQAVEHFGELTIGDVMTTPAITVRESDGLDRALTRMQRHGVRRMPVVDQTGSLRGLLVVDDVIAHVTDELAMVVFLHKTARKRENVRRPSHVTRATGLGDVGGIARRDRIGGWQWKNRSLCSGRGRAAGAASVKWQRRGRPHRLCSGAVPTLPCQTALGCWTRAPARSAPDGPPRRG